MHWVLNLSFTLSVVCESCKADNGWGQPHPEIFFTVRASADVQQAVTNELVPELTRDGECTA